MKTTIELPDSLARDAKALARKQGVTLRELVVNGLRHEIESRSAPPVPVDFCFPAVTGEGLYPGVDPSQLTSLAYDLPPLDK